MNITLLQSVFNLIWWSFSMQQIKFNVTALIPCGFGGNQSATQIKFWTDFSHGNEVACLCDQRSVSGALSNREHGLIHIRYFENGPLEPGYPSSRLTGTRQRTWEQNKDGYHFELELLTTYWPIVQNGKFSAAAALLVRTLKKVDFLKIHVDKQQTHDQAKKTEACCMPARDWLTLHLEALLFRTSVRFQISPLKVLVLLLPSFWEAFWK